MSGSQQLLLGGAPQAAPVDPYFYSVTSLLHGDGTNGAQNNTFLDSSTNNFTITRNGNTTQGSFSPFSQTGWSNFFDGAGDYLSVADNAAFTLGTSDFCVESWVYPLNVGTGSSESFISQWSGVASGYGWIFQYRSNKVLMYYSTNGSNIFNAIDAAATISNNAWTHIAFVRSGNTLSAYVNGTRVSNNTSFTANIFDGVTAVNVGRNADNLEYVNGYLSNTRLVVGSSVYDPSQSTITVPTAPLTAVANTKLLTCQANRFLDASSNAFAITRNGDVSVQPFSPFNPTTAYSTSTVGGSGYFDGSGDYLSFAGATANAMGSGDFTIEGWFYLTGTTGQGGSGEQGIIGVNTVLASRLAIRLQGTSTKVMSWWLNGSGNNVAGTTAVQQNTWYHFALVRSGSASNNVKLYLNGVLESQGTSTYDVPTGDYVVGRVYTDLNSEYWNGFLSQIRAVKGTAVYTGNFTPPTAPLTAISNTAYLLNFTNAGIFDNAADADYETVGNAQISTSVKKYGTGSMAFDGTGDYLPTASNQNFAFRTGDFTVEYWIYTNSSADDGIFQLSTTAGGFATSYTNGMMMAVVSGVLYYALGGSSISTGFTINNSTWYHIAMCRTSGVVKVFVNGTQVASAANTTDVTATNLVIGGYYSTSYTLVGYIDDFRISSGVGRYPYNFTPPTAEFPNIGGTVTLTADPYFDYTTLLLPGNGTNGAQNNTFLDSSTNAFTVTRNGNTTQGTFSPFSQTGWGNYFNGSNSYLSLANNIALRFGTGDFSVEGWVYLNVRPSGSSVAQIVGTQWSGTSPAGAWTMWVRGTTNKVEFCVWNSILLTSTTALAANTWYHVAVTRSGTSTKLFINGTNEATATSSFDYNNSTYTTIIGRYDDTLGGVEYLNGYISNVRLVKGTAVYTANFTPPTTPLTAVTNTVLLTCQSNRFVDNSTNAFAITVGGSPSIQAFSPFSPTAAWSAATNGGSGYFDGSGDYLNVTNSGAFDMNTSFTVEFWSYQTASGNYGVIGVGGGAPSWSTSNGHEWLVLANYSGTFYFQYNAGGSPGQLTTTGAPLNQWNHIVVGFNGTTASAWINGTRVATGSISITLPTTRNILAIGNIAALDAPFVGYLSNVRIVRGTDVYGVSNSTITVPTAPLTAITNTSLLCNFTNAGIYDATSKNDLETVGNAQISTTQSRFSGSSMYFDGTGDCLLTSSRLFVMGTADFTVECWVYISSLPGAEVGFVGQMPSTGSGFLLGLAGGGNVNKPQFTIGQYSSGTNPTVVSASNFPTSQWVHVAGVRYNGTIYLYINGSSVGTPITNTGNINQTAVAVGRTFPGFDGYYMTGYVNDVRITYGIARYTASFTPPTTAFLTL